MNEAMPPVEQEACAQVCASDNDLDILYMLSELWWENWGPCHMKEGVTQNTTSNWVGSVCSGGHIDRTDCLELLILQFIV